MPPFEPFTHAAARAAAHRAATRRTVAFALLAGVCVSAAPLVPLLAPRWSSVALAGFALVLCVSGSATLRSLARLGRVLVAVQVSAAGLLTRDARGRTQAVPWRHIHHVDLAADGVDVVVRGIEAPRRLHFGSDWPHADRLARRLVRHAHAHGCTLCVDGVASHALSLAPLRAALSPGADAV